MQSYKSSQLREIKPKYLFDQNYLHICKFNISRKYINDDIFVISLQDVSTLKRATKTITHSASRKTATACLIVFQVQKNSNRKKKIGTRHQTNSVSKKYRNEKIPYGSKNSWIPNFDNSDKYMVDDDPCNEHLKKDHHWP